MAEMSPVDRVQAMLELQKKLEQHVTGAKAALDEISNLASIAGDNAASAARSVKAANTVLAELKKVVSGQRGLGHKLALWRKSLENMGFQFG